MDDIQQIILQLQSCIPAEGTGASVGNVALIVGQCKTLTELAAASESNQTNLQGTSDTLISLLATETDAGHEESCASILWTISRLSRRSMAKNTSCYSNIEYLTSHGLIEKLVNSIKKLGQNASVALPASFLVMVLASDNEGNQVGATSLLTTSL